jgi:hypothetical protein
LRDFMQRGGLRAWILAQQQDIERQQDYWGGNIELAVCRRRDGNAPESALRTRHGAT